MPYVERDQNGRVTGLHKAAGPAAGRELLPGNHPDVTAFLEEQGVTAASNPALDRSDAEMSRVLEDLVDLLIRKGVIEASELPTTARNKLIRRRDLRGAREWLSAIVAKEKII